MRNIRHEIHTKMSKISLGFKGPKKPILTARPSTAKRKPVFDDDDDSDAEDDKPTTKTSATIESITTLDDNAHRSSPNHSTLKSNPLSQPSVTAGPKHALHNNSNNARPAENLSSKHTTAKHAKEAEHIDPTIYDYDSIYDAMKAPSHASSATNTSTTNKPKYMSALVAAAEVRKRDAIRAADRKTAREREAEGDAFKDKEAFVTGAYKRQQEELRKAEAEEAQREEDERERRRKGEGGLGGGFYKRMLEEGEKVHQAGLRAVEERKAMGEVGRGAVEEEEEEKDGVGKKREKKSKEENAREMGVVVNEEGEVVDKRELLKAGLNAEGPARVKRNTESTTKAKGGGGGGGRRGESVRERESRELEEQLLGKHGLSDDDHDDDGHSGGPADATRASKSRRMEDELMAGLESP